MPIYSNAPNNLGKFLLIFFLQVMNEITNNNNEKNTTHKRCVFGHFYTYCTWSWKRLPLYPKLNGCFPFYYFFSLLSLFFDPSAIAHDHYISISDLSVYLLPFNWHMHIAHWHSQHHWTLSQKWSVSNFTEKFNLW